VDGHAGLSIDATSLDHDRRALPGYVRAQRQRGFVIGRVLRDRSGPHCGRIFWTMTGPHTTQAPGETHGKAADIEAAKVAEVAGLGRRA
jgi:hypothetical protein